MESYDISEVCISVNDINELNSEKVLKTVKKNTFAVIRGLYSPSELKSSLDKIKREMSSAEDHPAIGETSRSIMRNYQKIVVGGGAQRDYYVPRCVRVAYNPIWSADVYDMRKHFSLLAKARNIILSKPIDFAINKVEEDGLWTASRIQHYPAGGGFFMKHKDTVLEKHTEAAGLKKFIQIVLLITQKGEDFKEGGAFVEINGQNVNLEDSFGRGDIIIYDGRSNHGVDDIDPNKLLDFNQVNGRVAALASLYTDLSKNRTK